ncbi:MAG: hypothetical protein RL318_975 [Fibrobacterota bacterium]|jgi:hypothetical protein
MLPALLLSLLGAGILPSLPKDDPAMPWLVRWDGSPGCTLPSVRPWPGEAVLACLEGLDTNALTAVDRAQRRRLVERIDLRGSTRPGYGRHPFWRSGPNDRDFLSIDMGVRAYGHYDGRSVVTGRLTDSVYSIDTLPHDLVGGYSLHPRVDLLLGPEVSVWARLRQLTEVSDRKRWYKAFNADQGVYQTALFAKDEKTPSMARTSDWLEGAVETDLPWLRAQAGVQTLRWGSAPVNPLLFSGNAEPMGWASIRKSVGPVRAEVLYGAPLGITYAEERRLYAHRTSVDLSPWIPAEISFSEAMVSNAHPFQPLYLMPVFPLFFVGHYVGTPDNLLMDFDLSVRPTSSVRLTAELFLDDLQNFLGFFSRDWGNKWGLALGAELKGCLGSGSLDQFQITRIEPWVYTTSATDFEGKPYTTPVHFGTLLGHPSGPNSLTLDWNHRQDLSTEWSWTSEISALWKGTDLGSSWRDLNGIGMEDGMLQVKAPRKEWLGGDIASRAMMSAGIEWRFHPQWRLNGNLGGSWQDSLGHTELGPVVAASLAWRM